MKYSKIAGTGSYLPEKIVTNSDLEKILDTSDQWIRERTGICERRVAHEGETSADMAEVAGQRALNAAGINPEEVGLLVVGTTTPDLVFPSTACLLQARLGLPDCGAMDVNAACSGFMYALSIADKYVRCGDVKKALVIGVDKLTSMIDWNDRGTAVLFGDGAGAVVLEAADEGGILSTHIHAAGRHSDLLGVDVGVSTGFKAEERGGVRIKMKGNEVFKVAVRTLGRIVDETLAYNEMEKTELDWLIPHQANHRIISATAKKLGMTMDQVVVTVDKHGNTSAASVPLALDEAVRSGKIKRGDVMLLEAFGGGFTWASALVRY
ncbi:MAG: ketoacyl-ACP synthase III [Xanthomonadales bacterium]|nr:ketoacyl-ACP synthase III [Gammaproteobacteria bacterium]MBT8074395.1 ketoacyl-ACP synthase III [Gammaproteobacteria bacterium]NNK05247.1 ketoacyl-ACP synthase III [Xanthomonadales bacterium]NNL00513.1 ketoacyl-ACP synthase III [Xanthomonadales bacterium]